MSLERKLLGRWHNGDLLPEEYMKLMKETKQLLAQPEQEPVAWIDDGCNGLIKQDTIRGCVIPLYTSPPKPLTPQQISVGNQSMLNVTREAFKQGVEFAEKAHGIGGE